MLIVILGLLAACGALMIGLMYQSQGLNILVRGQAGYLESQLNIHDAQARIGLSLIKDRTTDPALNNVIGSVSSSSDFSCSAPNASAPLSVRWSNGDSVNVPLPKAFGSYANLIATSGVVPQTGYQNTTVTNTSNGVPVAQGHTAVALESSGQPYLTEYSHSFPYGAYAPQGSIQMDQVGAWSNPTLAESKVNGNITTSDQQSSGVPVLLRAANSIQVNTTFPNGRAYSDHGPITLAGDAVGFTGPTGPELYCASLTSQIQNCMTSLSQGTLDKTALITGTFFSFQTVRDLFQGNLSLKSAISVEQALSFPMFPVPVIQEDVAVTLLMIHHPWPADSLGGSGGDGSQAEALGLQMQSDSMQVVTDNTTIANATADKQLNNQTITNDTATLAASNDTTTNTQMNTAINAANVKNSADDQAITNASTDISNMNSTIAALEQQIQADTPNGQKGNIPTTAYEDATANDGTGYDYVDIVGAIFDAVENMIEGKEDLGTALDGINPPPRLVHFGSLAPQWEFDDNSGAFNSTATWTVPEGKTLQFSTFSGKPTATFTIRGDLWIQRGATLYVNGNLVVASPGIWYDLAGAATSLGNSTSGTVTIATSDPAFPAGRIIMEPGASLVVSGDLNAAGGTPTTGSVVVCSNYGSIRGLTNGILVSGNVNIAHGIYSGVTLLDVFGYYTNGEFGTFYQNWLMPAIATVLPDLSKFFGPWNKRQCYFAKYCTTFCFLNFLDEFGIGEIPVPCPIPASNCEIGFFDELTKVYSYVLNSTTGENLYTQCDWWLFGRGVVPFCLKVEPDAIKSALSNLNYTAITEGAAKTALVNFAENLIPQLLISAVNTVLRDGLKQVLTELIPFSFPSCPGDDGTDESSFETDIQNDFESALANGIKANLYSMFKTVLGSVQTAVEGAASGVGEDNYLCREVPGLLLYSGGNMNVGLAGEPLGANAASAYFFAQGNLQVSAQKIVGCLVSATGNIVASGQFLYYPYFTTGSLYNPLKPSDELANDIELTLSDLNPGNNTAIDLGVQCTRISAAGWLR